MSLFYRPILYFCVMLLPYFNGLQAQSWVIGVEPAQNERSSPAAAMIYIQFSERMNPASATSQSILIHSQTSGFFEPVNIGINSVGDAIFFDTDRPFKPGEKVIVTATTALENDSGIPMPTPFTWKFTVAATAGSANFSNTATIPIGSNPYYLTSADLDNDNDLDIITANRNGGSVSILRNDGNGNFSNLGSTSAGSLVESVTSGDFNADGNLDLAVVNAGSNNRATILLGDGSGGVTVAANVTVGSNPHTINAGDLDGDGDVDLVVSNFSGASLSILMNDGSGNFSVSSSPGTGSGPEIGLLEDLDLDGDLDMPISNFISGNLVILENSGGSFSTSATIPLGNSSHLAAARDLNGNGFIDLAIPNAGSGTVSLFFNDGNGSFNAGPALSQSGSPWSVNAADFTGDGSIDLAVSSFNSARLQIWLAIDTPNFFENDTSLTVGNSPQTSVSGDFNGDGALDIAVANDASNSVSILLNDPGVAIGQPGTPQPKVFQLRQNFPNPFNPETVIGYSLSVNSHIKLEIYDIVGKKVRTLVNKKQVPGNFRVTWDGRNQSGNPVTSGVYIYRIQFASNTFRPEVQHRKMILLR